MKTENSVHLLGFYGSDESHCLSAWQSTNLDLDIELPEDVSERIHTLFKETVKTKKKSSGELLKMLAEHGHHTPFEKSCFHFQLRADIATHIHCLKHRVGVSINSESARYKELDDKWYVPNDWEGISLSETLEVIPGVIIPEGTQWGEILEEHCFMSHLLYHAAVKDLSKPLGRKRAKESARFFFPYAKQLDYDMMFNFRSLMHFVGLRGKDAAQVEVREVALQMVELIRDLPGDPFALSLEAFGLV